MDFVMLLKDYTHACSLSGNYLSRKFDGQRALWIPSTRGLLVRDLPFVPTTARCATNAPPHATGLWSRYGNPIFAPDDWLDQLPDHMLDGELIVCDSSGEPTGYRQDIPVKGYTPSFDGVRYFVFDAPHPSRMLEPFVPNGFAPKPFHISMQRLNNINCSAIKVVEQTQLGYGIDAIELFGEACAVAQASGWEGLVLRYASSVYEYKRSNGVYRWKPTKTGTGVVVGHVDGKGKHSGRMGSVVVEALIDGINQRFSISGFTDEERMSPPALGTTINFKYREVTRDGKPVEARYQR